MSDVFIMDHHGKWVHDGMTSNLRFLAPKTSHWDRPDHPDRRSKKDVTLWPLPRQNDQRWDLLQLVFCGFCLMPWTSNTRMAGPLTDLNSHSLRFDGFRSINPQEPRTKMEVSVEKKGINPQFLSIYRWNFHGNHPSSDFSGHPPWLLPPLSCWSRSLHSQDCRYPKCNNIYCII